MEGVNRPLLPRSFRAGAMRAAARAKGLTYLALVILSWFSLAAWAAGDPWRLGGEISVFAADAVLQSFGLAAVVALAALSANALAFAIRGHGDASGAFAALASVAPCSAAMAAIPYSPSFPQGFGGSLGDTALGFATRSMFMLDLAVAAAIAAASFGLVGGAMLLWSVGVRPRWGASPLRSRDPSSPFGHDADVDAVRALAARFAPASAKRSAVRATAGPRREPSFTSKPRRPATIAEDAKPPRPATSAAPKRDGLAEQAERLQNALASLGEAGQVEPTAGGPNVSLFVFRSRRPLDDPDRARLSCMLGRGGDAPPVRVTVLPGVNTYGLEAPNPRRECVTVDGVIGSDAFRSFKGRAPLALGVDLGGAPFVADLAAMGHLALFGRPGSGKTNALHGVVHAIVHAHRPQACRMILIDPRDGDFACYDGAPHLVGPIARDARGASDALAWAACETETRRLRLAKTGMRTLEDYNALAASGPGRAVRLIETGFDAASGAPVREREILDLSFLPPVVVVIDELLELAREPAAASSFATIARWGHRAGVHLVFATERPSLECASIAIREGATARASFRASSRFESRTALGATGAELLCAAGDMLLERADGSLIRLQAPLVTPADARRMAARFAPSTQASPTMPVPSRRAAALEPPAERRHALAA